VKGTQLNGKSKKNPNGTADSKTKSKKNEKAKGIVQGETVRTILRVRQLGNADPH